MNQPIDNLKRMMQAAADAGHVNARVMCDEDREEYGVDFRNEWVFTTIQAAIYLIRSGQYTTEKIAGILGFPEYRVKDLKKFLTAPVEEINPFAVLLEKE